MDTATDEYLHKLAADTTHFYDVVSQPKNREPYDGAHAVCTVEMPDVDTVKARAKGGDVTLFLYTMASVHEWNGAALLPLIKSATESETRGTTLGLCFQCPADIRRAIETYKPSTVVLNLPGMSSGQPRDDSREFPVLWLKKTAPTESGSHPLMRVAMTRFADIEAAVTGHSCLKCLWLDFEGSDVFGAELVRRRVVPVTLGWGLDLVVPSFGHAALPMEALATLPTHFIRAYGVLTVVQAMSSSGLSLGSAVDQARREVLEAVLQNPTWKNYRLQLELTCRPEMSAACTVAHAGLFGWPLRPSRIEAVADLKSYLAHERDYTASPSACEAAVALIRLITSDSSDRSCG